MNPRQRHNCAAWTEVFTGLGKAGVPSLEQLQRIASDEVRFRDPFNDLEGVPALRKLLEHTRRQVRDVRFRVLDRAEAGQRVYLKWEMTGTVRLLGHWRVQGMSELAFDTGGKLTLHQDYWDASEQFYARLPVLGWLLRWIRARAGV